MREPRVLLVRPDHLGDVLLTLPAVAALKRSMPSVRLTYLVASGLESVPDRCPAVDQTLSLPYPPPDAPAEPLDWGVLESAVPAIQNRFDVAVLLRPHDPWSGALVKGAGVPVRVGFDRDGMRRFLTEAVLESPKRHAVLLPLDAVTPALRRLDPGAGSPAVSPAERVFVPTDQDHAEAEDALGRVQADVGRRPVVLHPGTGWRLKNWPPERWGRLASDLHRRFGVRALITGGNAEQELVGEVAAHGMGGAVALPQSLSLGGFAALLSRAALLVASDSGPLHLAAMLGTRVVGLYGPGDPALATPWCPPENRTIVRIDLPCSPCGVMHDPPCGAVREPACVTGVDVESVLASLEGLTAGVR